MTRHISRTSRSSGRGESADRDHRWRRDRGALAGRRGPEGPTRARDAAPHDPAADALERGPYSPSCGTDCRAWCRRSCSNSNANAQTRFASSLSDRPIRTSRDRLNLRRRSGIRTTRCTRRSRRTQPSQRRSTPQRVRQGRPRRVLWRATRSGPVSGAFDLELRVWDRDSHFDRRTRRDRRLTSAQVRRDLNDAAGVSVYRDGFRVLPYGQSGRRLAVAGRSAGQQPDAAGSRTTRSLATSLSPATPTQICVTRPTARG